MKKNDFGKLLHKAFRRQMQALEISEQDQRKYIKAWVPILWESFPAATRRHGTVQEIFAGVPPLSLCLLMFSFPKAMAETLTSTKLDVCSA